MAEPRPTGEMPSTLGAALMWVAAAGFAVALVLPASAAEWRPVTLWGSVGLFNVGLLMWAVGQVLRGLWHLPGRDVSSDG